ncbi:carbamoyltransferase [Candidatus Woesearchaeota archaeon]|nr:carbamoyltransferase [Candidatus Woesearchaeota archaeon]
MSTYILGISCYYHDSSAALLKDGTIVAAAEEERFTRKKHDTSFPINAVSFCLESQGITIKDVDYIGFYEKPFLKLERVLSQHLEMFPYSLKTFLGSTPSWINEKLRVPRIIRKKLCYNKDILFIEHHLAHAASAYLLSPFKKSAILTVDGVGEWTTTAYGIGKGNDIHLIKEIMFPTSLGLIYSTITAYLGFSVNNSEYKVMGLSPYGNMNRKTNIYYQKLKKVVDVKEDGSYRFDMSYFIYHYADRMPSKKLCRLLGGPVRKPGEELTQRHKDIAAALQMVLEDVMTKILNHVHKVTKQDNIVLAGGVALNSVYNGKILRNTKFKKIWIQPDAGDGGTSMGVASYIYHTLLGKKREFVLKDAYLGPSYSTKHIKSFLDKNEIKYSEFKTREELLKTTAKLIYENNVIGWFQGGMEIGPRALGARSILSNACNPEMKEILNLKVKHREKFRPFAPVVCEDDALKYFDCDNPIPEATDFMLMVYPIKKQWRTKIPSVTHVDGSGRLQTIRRGQNPLYYDLIKEFGRLSGIPIIINTSFNIRGEPIVCTPYDTYKCMMGTGIDYLVMDNFLIKRDHNSRDIWDSEKYATD